MAERENSVWGKIRVQLSDVQNYLLNGKYREAVILDKEILALLVRMQIDQALMVSSNLEGDINQLYDGRVIGQPGDVINIPDEGGLMINGNLQIEDGIFYDTRPYDTEAVRYPITLKDDEYFIMADMRSGAKDSRLFGAVNKKEIKGKVITILRRSSL